MDGIESEGGITMGDMEFIQWCPVYFNTKPEANKFVEENKYDCILNDEVHYNCSLGKWVVWVRPAE